MGLEDLWDRGLDPGAIRVRDKVIRSNCLFIIPWLSLPYTGLVLKVHGHPDSLGSLIVEAKCM